MKEQKYSKQSAWSKKNNFKMLIYDMKFICEFHEFEFFIRKKVAFFSFLQYVVIAIPIVSER